MRKFLFALLYVFAGLVSIGVWSLAVSFFVPFTAWVAGQDYIEKFLPIIIIAVSALAFVVHLFLVVRDRLKGRKTGVRMFKFANVFVHAVPLAVGVLLYWYFVEKYCAAGWVGEDDDYLYRSCLDEKVVCNKFGRELFRGESIYTRGDIAYSYYDDGIGSIFDLDTESLLLEDTNLMYGADFFSANGMYGMVSKSTGAVVLPARYDSLEFYDNGWLLAVKNGRYGLLDYLGYGSLDFEYESIRYVGTNDDGNYIIECTKADGGDVEEYILENHYCLSK